MEEKKRVNPKEKEKENPMDEEVDVNKEEEDAAGPTLGIVLDE